MGKNFENVICYRTVQRNDKIGLLILIVIDLKQNNFIYPYTFLSVMRFYLSFDLNWSDELYLKYWNLNNRHSYKTEIRKL